MTSKAFSIAAMLIVGTGCAFAQQSAEPSGRFFAGYSYFNLDTNGYTSRQNFHGFEIAGSKKIRGPLSVEGDFSGHFKNYQGVGVHDYFWFGGPRADSGPAFVHALFGFNHAVAAVSGFGLSDDSFAMAFGGGAEWPPRSRVAFRISTDYVLTRHGGETQNNFRSSAGVVFRFGGASRPRAATAPVPGPRGPETDAPLLGLRGIGSPEGFQITSVAPNSPASAAFLKQGDIITEADGARIQSAADLERAAAQARDGELTLHCLILVGTTHIDSDRKVRLSAK